MLKTSAFRFGICALLFAGANGCGGSGPVPVKGIVRLNGEPLAHASVTFIAQDEGGRDATGTTDAKGVFQLSTFKPGDGALRGNYKVVIQAATVVEGSAATQEEAMRAKSKPLADPKSRVAPRFSQPDQTILVQVVPANGDVVFDITSE